ncbi:MAG TPA: SDR family NAD(P)-dependent oxidoreductase [Mycobacteriales bacterium]|nr:SDR family NAD(P)-dependent oxidoreductase [Mycobacteriales bacterium]
MTETAATSGTAAGGWETGGDTGGRETGWETDGQTGGGVEPIAIVGLACRVPGAGDAREFWRNLVDGVESVTFTSLDEQRALGRPDHLVDDPAYVPAAPVLAGFDEFDAALFDMTRREAQLADPQHRLFLELAYTALQDAGYDPARYPGDVGVYGGTGTDDYQWQYVRANPKVLAASGGLSTSVGNNPDYVATLVSYKLNLRGPSFTLHTACSTSLVAFHLACEALRNGECDMALAGGVCIELPHGGGYVYHDGGITSPDGHCRPFDARAAGTVWGSGGGMTVLKRLADAIADRDDIRAVVLGNAVNNDGAAKVGFTAPSKDGQAQVVGQALGLAGIDPRTVTYVEAHGTGTALGDPIEVAALSSVYARDTTDRGWCGIGSVKSNLGHLSQAAGVVGLIKTVLAMQHGVLPPTLHYEQPNPAIDFDAGPFYVNAVRSRWRTGGGPRRAAVSSFGIGGTNAHVVLQQAPELDRPRGEPRPAHLLPVSARTPTALAAAVDRLAAHLREHPDAELADVSYTLRTGRVGYPHRAVVVAHDAADAAAALADRKRLHTAAGAGAPRVAFLFSGQGAQYAGMGAELYRHEPAFRAAVDECADVLAGELGADLRDLLFADEDGRADADAQLGRTEFTQPALFTIEYALARLWQSWGVQPDGMIGHSIGEYVAATLAGVFRLPDALRLVATRGRLMQSMPPGAMLAVPRDETEIAGTLPAGLALATVNGPGTCVVAGPAELVQEFADRLRAGGIRGKTLRTSHAFHSPMMEPVLAEFAAAVAGTERRAPALPFLSNVTGDWITDQDATDPDYWARHLRSTVRFGDCLGRLLADGSWALLECGPGRQLTGLARLQAPKDGLPPLPSLPGPGERTGDLAALLTAAGRLWTVGVPVAAEAVGGTGWRVPLPAYPYERARHWVDPDPAAGAGPVAEPAPTGPRPVEGWFTVPVWHQAGPLVAAQPPGRCLAFTTDGVSALVAGSLRAAGAEVVEVRPGDAYGRDADGRYLVRPAARADYEALLADLAAAGGVPARIVHAWTTAPAGAATAVGNGDAAGDGDAAGPAAVGDGDAAGNGGAVGAGDAAGATWAAQDAGFFSLLWLTQALTAAGLADPTRLDVLTRGTQDVRGDDLTRPEHATVAGIARVLPLEVPALAVRMIDLDPAAPDPTAAAAAVTELTRAGGAELVALRSGRRWTPDHEQVAVPAPPADPADGTLADGPPTDGPQDGGPAASGPGASGTRADGLRADGLRDGGVYLITGGLGGIGATIAEDLAGRVRARLVLIGRSALPPEADWDDPAGQDERVRRAIATVRRIERAGGEVLVLRADVTDEAALRRVREQALARFGRLDCIVHAAGTPGGGMAEVKERAAAEAVLAPKLTGTLALRAVFGDLPLDQVVLCSSVTGSVGGFGQVDYCAANAFLDAHARSAHGWPARVVSLGWGGWAEVGMAAAGTAPAAFRALERAEPAGADHPVDHPVLSSRQETGSGLPAYRGTVSAATHWLLDEHRIAGTPVVPGTGHLEVLRAAVAATLPPVPGRVLELRDVLFLQPMSVPDGGSAEIRVQPRPAAGDGLVVELTSTAGGVTSTHARAGADLVDAGPPAPFDLAAVRARTRPVDSAAGFGRGGRVSMLTFGPRWAGLREAYAGDGEELALIQAPDEVAAELDRWWLHPALLDVATSFGRGRGTGSYLPFGYGRLLVRAPLPAHFWSHLRYRDGGEEAISADLTLVDEAGRVLVEVEDFVLRRVDAAAVGGSVGAAAEPAAQPAAAQLAAQPAGGSGRQGEPAGPGDISPADGADAFRRMLATDLGPHVLVTARSLAEIVSGVRRLTAHTVEEGLPAPRVGAGAAAGSAGVPQTELEATIARIWAEVLGFDRVDVDDSFFDLGGNSLVAVQLIAQIRKAVGVRLSMRALFDTPTVGSMAKQIEQLRADGAVEAAAPQIPRLTRQKG